MMQNQVSYFSMFRWVKISFWRFSWFFFFASALTFAPASIPFFDFNAEAARGEGKNGGEKKRRKAKEGSKKSETDADADADTDDEFEGAREPRSRPRKGAQRIEEKYGAEERSGWQRNGTRLVRKPRSELEVDSESDSEPAPSRRRVSKSDDNVSLEIDDFDNVDDSEEEFESLKPAVSSSSTSSTRKSSRNIKPPKGVTLQSGEVKRVNERINGFGKAADVDANPKPAVKFSYSARATEPEISKTEINRVFRGDMRLEVKTKDGKERVKVKGQEFEKATGEDGRLVLVLENTKTGTVDTATHDITSDLSASKLDLNDGGTVAINEEGADITDYHIERRFIQAARGLYHSEVENLEDHVIVRAVVLDLSQTDTPCEICFKNITTYESDKSAWRARKDGDNDGDSKDRLQTDQDWLHEDHWSPESDRSAPGLVVVRLLHNQTYTGDKGPSANYLGDIGGEKIDVNQESFDRAVMPVVTKSTVLFGTQTSQLIHYRPLLPGN